MLLLKTYGFFLLEGFGEFSPRYINWQKEIKGRIIKALCTLILFKWNIRMLLLQRVINTNSGMHLFIESSVIDLFSFFWFCWEQHGLIYSKFPDNVDKFRSKKEVYTKDQHFHNLIDIDWSEWRKEGWESITYILRGWNAVGLETMTLPDLTPSANYYTILLRS